MEITSLPRFNRREDRRLLRLPDKPIEFRQRSTGAVLFLISFGSCDRSLQLPEETPELLKRITSIIPDLQTARDAGWNKLFWECWVLENEMERSKLRRR